MDTTVTPSLRHAARTDRGLVRENNQDSVYAGSRLLAVADGMGGHAAGEVASRLVIGALAQLDDGERDTDPLAACRAAVLAGNNAIAELVRTRTDLTGMGTTLTAVLFDGPRLTLMHIGDSRAYLRRDQRLARITRDDTYVQSLIDAGQITEKEAAVHPHRAYLERALTGDRVEPTLTIREARVGDRVLLCSDGLTGVVPEATLEEILRIPSPDACADRLIELALVNGGPDNVTVVVADIVADVVDAPPPEQAPPDRPEGTGRRTVVALAVLVAVITVVWLAGTGWSMPF